MKRERASTCAGDIISGDGTDGRESRKCQEKENKSKNNRGICRVAPRMERREIMHTRPEKEERKITKKALLCILSRRLRVIPHGMLLRKRMSQECVCLIGHDGRRAACTVSGCHRELPARRASSRLEEMYLIPRTRVNKIKIQGRRLSMRNSIPASGCLWCPCLESDCHWGTYTSTPSIPCTLH